MAGLSPINRALNLVPKRAESRQAERLGATFVDMGIAAALEAVDHQILYGRRGTGKTHALRFLQTLQKSRSDIALYFDLRTVGSPEGLFLGEATSITERAARLLIDLLAQLQDGLLEAVLEDESLLADTSLVEKLDSLFAAITTIRVAGEVEIFHEGERHEADKSTGALGVSVGSRLRWTPSSEPNRGSSVATQHERSDGVPKRLRSTSVTSLVVFASLRPPSLRGESGCYSTSGAASHLISNPSSASS